MAKLSVSDWDIVPGNNADVNSIDISPTGPVSGGDDGMRNIMAQIASYTRRGADLATSATLNLDSVDSLVLDVTGVVTVTAVTLTSGHWRIVRAAGAFQMTASASLIIDGETAVNYTTTAGDLLYFEGYAAGVVRVWVLGRRKFTSTSTAVAKFNGTTGLLQNSGVLIDGSNNVSGVVGLAMTGAISGVTNIGLSGNVTAHGASAYIQVDDASGLAMQITPISGVNNISSYNFPISGYTALNIDFSQLNLRNNTTTKASIANGLWMTGSSDPGAGNIAATAIRAADGTILNPSYSFASDSSTGLYRIGASTVGVSTGNALIGYFNTTGLSIGPTSITFGTTTSATVGIGTIQATQTANAAAQFSRTTSDGTLVGFYRAAVAVGSVSVTGSATAFNTSSDEFLKHFIGVYDPAKAIEIIRADPVRDFNWVEEYGGGYAVGWGAQTSHAVSPDLATPGHGVLGDDDYQPWGVDQGKRTPYLWAATTHILDVIDNHETRLRALEQA